MFSAPVNMGQLSSITAKPKTRRSGCAKKHAKPFVKCAKGIVYEILLTDGKAHNGQSPRSVNDRAGEDERVLGDNYSRTNFTEHCRKCTKRGCMPRLNDIKILPGSSDIVVRLWRSV